MDETEFEELCDHVLQHEGHRHTYSDEDYHVDYIRPGYGKNSIFIEAVSGKHSKQLSMFLV